MASAPGDSRYRLPPPNIQHIVDVAPSFYLTKHAKGCLITLDKRFLSLSELQRPVVKLAGLCFDVNHIHKGMLSFSGITIHHFLNNHTVGLEKKVLGLPSSAKVSYVTPYER
ncbi:prolyl oligopeptidase family protein [Salvia divinorum]|uniref:Prolyl oligopeptidase family protein n=1 Tax=Salvia divinorum TaxID=28513 RepID=A0ABD1IKE5_SALDI